MRHWLMKSEPDEFSILDLRQRGRAPWDGVRNYQARNFMRDDMRAGDLALFYHSSCAEPAAAGVARIAGAARPDPSAWDRKSPYFDPKSSVDNPIWCLVEVAFAEMFPSPVTLVAMKADPALRGMLVARRGMRLSIQPVSAEHFQHVLKLGRRKQ